MTFPSLDIRLFGYGSLPDRTITALGSFDGVHSAHRVILQTAAELARRSEAVPGVFSFIKPPFSYCPDAGRCLLSDTEEKDRLFTDSGCSFAAYADFPSVRDMDAGDFIENILIKQCRAVGVVCGFNFTFGKDRRGTPELLKQYFGSSAVTVAPVMHEGLPVSSSRIRSAVGAGDVGLAAAMLSRPYSMCLPVLSGRHDGTKIGFPTLNQIPPTDRLVPACGVYVTSAAVPDDGVFPSVTDVGFAPTLDSSGVLRMETHILGRCGDLYGKKITVSFYKRIRSEKTFANADELAGQIADDVSTAQNFFASGQDHGVKEFSDRI